MRAIDKMVEWWKKSGKNLDPNMLCSPASEICAEMLRLAAEEKSGDEGVLNEDSVRGAIANILDMNDDVAQHMDITIKGEPTVLVSYLKDLISRHPTPKEAPEGLIRLCEELLDIVENPYYSEGNESDTETIHKSDSFDFDKAKKTLSRYRPAPSRTEKPEIVCPACDFEGEAVKVCPSCGTPEKGKASFAGIAPSRTGELVKRLREFMINRRDNEGYEGHMAERELNEILRDFEGGA